MEALELSTQEAVVVAVLVIHQRLAQAALVL
jgi:hypothetical protein